MVEKAFGILTSLFRIFQSPLQQGCHGLPTTAQPTEDQIPHISTGTFYGRGPASIVLEGNDILYDGCNTIGAAKRQRNILRDYFMNEGQLPGPMASSYNVEYCYTVTL